MTDKADLERRRLLVRRCSKSRTQFLMQSQAQSQAQSQENRLNRLAVPRNFVRHARSKPLKVQNHLGQVRALWRSLGYLGVLPDDSEAALKSYVCFRTGVSHPACLSQDQGVEILAELKAWAACEGVMWPQPYDGQTPGKGERRAVALCLWAKLAAKGLAPGNSETSMATCLSHAGLPFSTRNYSFADWDKALVVLSSMWRPHATNVKKQIFYR